MGSNEGDEGALRFSIFLYCKLTYYLSSLVDLFSFYSY